MAELGGGPPKNEGLSLHDALLMGLAGLATALTGLICFGMWAAILFQILTTINASASLWALFYMYVPTSLASMGLSAYIMHKLKTMENK